MKEFIIFSTVALAFMGAACKVALPDRKLEPQFVPAVWQSSHSSTNEPAGNWWRQFGDERLTHLVREALKRNLDLQATAIRLEQSLLRAEVAGIRKPTLEASLNSSKQRNNFIGLPIGGGGGVMTSRFVSHGFTLSSNWEIDVWGRLKAGEQKAFADSTAVHADLWAARQSLAAQVVKTWVALTESNEQLSLAQTNNIILDITVKLGSLVGGCFNDSWVKD